MCISRASLERKVEAKRERLALSRRGASETHHMTTHTSSRGLAVGGMATSLRVPPACLSVCPERASLSFDSGAMAHHGLSVFDLLSRTE